MPLCKANKLSIKCFARAMADCSLPPSVSLLSSHTFSNPATPAVTCSADDQRLPASASAPTVSALPAYWDNCSSINCTGDPSIMYNLTPLDKPFDLGGIGAPALITHSGHMSHLPTTNGMNVGFYGSGLGTTLYSLGHIHVSGGAYSSADSPASVVVYCRSGGPILQRSLLTKNLLPKVDFAALSKFANRHPQLYTKHKSSNHSESTLPAYDQLTLPAFIGPQAKPTFKSDPKTWLDNLLHDAIEHHKATPSSNST